MSSMKDLRRKAHDETRGNRTGRRNALTLRFNDALYAAIKKSAESNECSMAAEIERRIQGSFAEDAAERRHREIMSALSKMSA